MDILGGASDGAIAVVLHVIAASFLTILLLARKRFRNRGYPRSSVDDVVRDNVNFVAMQYYFGILNRSFLGVLAGRTLCAAKVCGVLTSPVVAIGPWNDPRFYVSPRESSRYLDVALESPQFLTRNRANFQIEASENRCAVRAAANAQNLLVCCGLRVSSAADANCDYPTCNLAPPES